MELRKAAKEMARNFKIPEGIFMGLVAAESGWNPNAISKRGAIGLTQVLPSTAKAMGYDPRQLAADPIMQLEAGGKYLKEMHCLFGDWEMALAAYNAGPHNVRKYNGIPPFKETRKYVMKILDYAKEYEPF